MTVVEHRFQQARRDPETGIYGERGIPIVGVLIDDEGYFRPGYVKDGCSVVLHRCERGSEAHLAWLVWSRVLQSPQHLQTAPRKP